MEIKNSNLVQTIECPQQKLKFFSYIEELQSTLPLLPLTPERSNKKWMVDPWDNHSKPRYASPQQSNYIDQMIEKYENKAFRIRKVEIHSQKIDKNKIETPLRKQKQNSAEKENRSRSRLYALTNPSVKIENKQIEKGPFKIPIQSFIYPVIKQTQNIKDKARRIERFHSFIARSIRK